MVLTELMEAFVMSAMIMISLTKDANEGEIEIENWDQVITFMIHLVTLWNRTKPVSSNNMLYLWEKLFDIIGNI